MLWATGSILVILEHRVSATRYTNANGLCGKSKLSFIKCGSAHRRPREAETRSWAGSAPIRKLRQKEKEIALGWRGKHTKKGGKDYVSTADDGDRHPAA